MDNTAEHLKCREAFEREYRCEGASFRNTNGDYNGPLNTFWEVWQVAWNTRAYSGEAVAFDEPIGWWFQHDETGRVAVCINDGVNDRESFLRLNERFSYCGELFTHPPRATADEDGREKLWALHMLGPDDVIAAPSKLAADAVAKNFNDYWEAHKHERGHDVHVVATVVEWPYRPLEHAKDVIASFAEYADLLEPFDAALAKRAEVAHGRS